MWLEIGFGLGDNLLYLASAHILDQNHDDNDTDSRTARKFLVGAEMHKGGVGTICTRIQAANDEKRYWNDFKLFDSTGSSIAYNSSHESDATWYDNVRLYMGDGVKLLPFIPDSSVSAVLITFPDPFMGTNQESFRILQLDVLDQIRRILISPDQVTKSEKVESIQPSICRLTRSGGRFYLATDHSGYHEWSHEQVSKFNDHRMQQDERANFHTELNSTLNYDDKTNVAQKPTDVAGTFKLVKPTPDRSLWLPVVSKYEQKGYDEGRKTCLSCWETI